MRCVETPAPPAHHVPPHGTHAVSRVNLGRMPKGVLIQKYAPTHTTCLSLAGDNRLQQRTCTSGDSNQHFFLVTALENWYMVSLLHESVLGA